MQNLLFLLFSVFHSHSLDTVSFLTLFFSHGLHAGHFLFSITHLFSYDIFSHTASFNNFLTFSLSPQMIVPNTDLVFLLRYLYNVCFHVASLFSLYNFHTASLLTCSFFLSQILFSLFFSHTTSIQHPTNHKTTSNNSGCRTINLS